MLRTALAALILVNDGGLIYQVNGDGTVTASPAGSFLAWATLIVSVCATVGLPYLVYRLNRRSEERIRVEAADKAGKAAIVAEARVESKATEAATAATKEAIEGMQDLIRNLGAELERVRGQLSEADMQLMERDMRIAELGRLIAGYEDRMVALQRMVAENWQLAQSTQARVEVNRVAIEANEATIRDQRGQTSSE